MFSLNVPVPGSVARITSELRPALAGSGVDRFRDRHSLVVKRFEGEDERSLPHLRERLRPALRGAPAFEARVARVDVFENPPRGAGPVVYLAVESPGIRALHARLVDAFGAIDGLEGGDYTPHVTLGRGGVFDADALAALSRRFDPVTWTVSELVVYDSRHREIVSRLSLPA